MMTILKLHNRNGNYYPVSTKEIRFNEIISELFGQGIRPLEYISNSPKTNLLEEKESFILLMALPGVNKSNIKIDIEKDVLTVSHSLEANEKNELYLQREFDFENFERSFNIPETVDQTGINAKFEEGILKITLPKKSESIDRGPKKIKIS